MEPIQEENLTGSNNISLEEVNQFHESTAESFEFSYGKSYCRTRVKMNKLCFSWEIERFSSICKIMKVIYSATFPETGEYQLKLEIKNAVNCEKEIQLFLRTKKSFVGSCFIFMSNTDENEISKSILGYIKNNTMICSIVAADFKNWHNLTINCTLEFFDTLQYNSIHATLLPIISQSSSDSNLPNPDDERIFITFKIDEEVYKISRKLLLATNSEYCKNLCDRVASGGDIRDLEIVEKKAAIKEMLLYIKTGIISEAIDYEILKDLLNICQLYDMPVLKKICEHRLIRLITKQNVVELFQRGFECDASDLLKHAKTFIQFYKKEIRHSLTKPLPEDVLTQINKLLTEESCKFKEFVLDENFSDVSRLVEEH